MQLIAYQVYPYDGSVRFPAPAIPSSVGVGDLMFMFMQVGQNVNITPPDAGWTLLVSNKGSLGGLTNGGMLVYTKTATSSDPGSSGTWSLDSVVNNMTMGLQVWRQAIVDTYVLGSTGSGAGGLAIPAMSASTAADALLAFWTAQYSSINSFSVSFPANMTNLGTSATGPCALTYRTLTSSGAIPTESATTNSGGTFLVGGVLLKTANVAPTVAAVGPVNGTVSAVPPQLQSTVTDSDTSQTDTMTFQVSVDSAFATGVTTLTGSANTPTNNTPVNVNPPANLPPGINYWRVHGVDTPGADSGYTAPANFILQPIC